MFLGAFALVPRSLFSVLNEGSSSLSSGANEDSLGRRAEGRQEEDVSEEECCGALGVTFT